MALSVPATHGSTASALGLIVHGVCQRDCTFLAQTFFCILIILTLGAMFKLRRSLRTQYLRDPGLYFMIP